LTGTVSPKPLLAGGTRDLALAIREPADNADLSKCTSRGTFPKQSIAVVKKSGQKINSP